VHGIARSLDEAHWDEIARAFLTTDDTDHADLTDRTGGK